jgi:hypothetical protein
MPPADRASARVVVGEMVEIASRAGPCPPDMSEFHWCLLAVMRSRRGVRLLKRWAELLMRSPPVPPEMPAHEPPDDYVPPGCTQDWKSSSPAGDETHRERIVPEGSTAPQARPGELADCGLPQAAEGAATGYLKPDTREEH